MLEDRNSYRNITKAIGLFGGLKVFQILISIARSKVIAVLLGSNGMGIFNLLTSTTDIVSSLSGCGLQTSAVRDIARAHETKNRDRINKIITVLRKIVFITGLIGVLITLVFSSFLSEIAFGSKDYSTSFKIISIVLLFNQINVGQIVLLQGTFHYKLIAQATLWGNITALVLTLPLYFILREKGIVPAIIVASFLTLFFTTYYSKKIDYKKIKIPIKKLWDEGKNMIQLGIVLAITGVLSRLSGYFINIVISYHGAVSDVGLYTAGFKIANSYIFLILSSMASDYVPRLSAIADNKTLFKKAINKQAILLTTLITPLIVIFIVFIKELIIILYSKDFLSITGMTELMMFGMLFRATSWVLSYSFVARGNSKVFFWSEFTITLISFGLKVSGYYLYGFTGLGIAFVFVYIVYTILLIILSKKNFQFHFSKEFWKIFIPQFILCLLCIVTMKLCEDHIKYIIGTTLLIISIFFSYKILDQKLNLGFIITKFLIKNK